MTADQPPETPKPQHWKISSANAREYALKSHAARKRARELAEIEAAKPQVSQTAISQAASLREVDTERVQRYDEHIARTEQALTRARDARDIQALTQALFRLEEIRCIYAGIPKPGQRRPGKDDGRRRPIVFTAPILPANAPTNSVPEPPAEAAEMPLVEVVR